MRQCSSLSFLCIHGFCLGPRPPKQGFSSLGRGLNYPEVKHVLLKRPWPVFQVESDQLWGPMVGCV